MQARNTSAMRKWPEDPAPARAAGPLPLADVPAMLWAARPDLSYEYLSPAWHEYTGISPGQAHEEGWSRGVHPEDLARWLDCCVRAFDAREPFEIEYRLRRRDGEYRWFLDRGAPRYSSHGAFAGYAGVCVEIEAHKRAQGELGRALERERKLRIATEEASRLKDGFLACVLQDLRSPVQAMATWAGHLRGRAGEASEAAQALEAMERNARAQDRILCDLLDLSRAARGRQPLRRAPPEEPLLRGVRVLVADADPAAREALTRMLGIAGAEARAAATADQVLQELAGWRPDVLLAEPAMRDAEGRSLIRALRALPAERGGCLRAAALGEAERPDESPRALAAGYDAQLAKPVEPLALLATVARLACADGA